MKLTVNNVDIVVKYDDFPIDPIEYSEIAFILFHKKYDLGNEHDMNIEDYATWEEMQAELESTFDYVTPVYMYEHSGVALKTTSFGDRWDSGQIGFACANYKDLGLTEWQDVDQLISNLLHEYQNYINGETYCVFIYDSETKEQIDCMSGFSSEEEAIQSATEQANRYND
jgi:hypothetical protein